MLKHVTICQSKRTQLALGGHWESAATSPGPDVGLFADRARANEETEAPVQVSKATDESTTSQDIFSSLTSGIWAPISRGVLQEAVESACSSPTPSLQSTSISRIGSALSSAPSSVFNSPRKSRASPLAAAAAAVPKIATSSSAIKVYAQTLGQEVEYLTLPVNAQTQSRHIIRALLRKFRLKHRDPNLFYLTLERWIRKDGLRQKSVMLLADEACPLQLQQCCSNPPHNDIKFTLQVKAGALVKIHCQDVCPNTKYKCLSLSAQTTVAETIELMLYCLDLAGSKKSDIANENSPLTTVSHLRQAHSPDSASSSSSSTSSSSGIESDPTSNQNSYQVPNSSVNHPRPLETGSRTGSEASITSASDMMNTSCPSQAVVEQFCLLIECVNTNYKRVLEADEYLVDLYQNLLDEVGEQPVMQSTLRTMEKPTKNNSSATSSAVPPHQPDQLFIIKLKRREELNRPTLKFTNPRQNMPLPPLPPSLTQSNNSDHIQSFVTTTQIEVGGSLHRPSSSLAIISLAAHKAAIDGANSARTNSMTTRSPTRFTNHHQRHMSAIVDGNTNASCPTRSSQLPPERLVWMPQIRPRRRNLTTASTTFCAQSSAASTGFSCKRRYDPAQLAQDLDRLDMTNECASVDATGSTAPVPDSPAS